MARVDKVCGIADHGPVDAQALVWAAGGRALLLETAREPLQPDLPVAGHLPLDYLAAPAGRKRCFSLLVCLWLLLLAVSINCEAATPSQDDEVVERGVRTFDR